jgi:hypothetical protein
MNHIHIFLQEHFPEIAVAFYPLTGPEHGPFQVFLIHITDSHQPAFSLEMVVVTDSAHSDNGLGNLVAGCDKTWSPEDMPGHNGKSRCSQQAFLQEISSLHNSFGSLGCVQPNVNNQVHCIN